MEKRQNGKSENPSLRVGDVKSRPIIIKRIFRHDRDKSICQKVHRFYNKRGMVLFSCRCGHGGYCHVQFIVEVEEPYYMHRCNRSNPTLTPIGKDYWADEEYHRGTFNSFFDIKIYKRGEGLIDIQKNPDVLLIDETEVQE